MEITITSIRPTQNGQGVRLTVRCRGTAGQQELRFFINDIQFNELHLTKGSIDEKTLEALEQADIQNRTMQSALNMLSYGSKSEKNLSLSLRRKGYPADVIGKVLEELREKGFVNAYDDALREAERCMKKSWSKRHIVSFLFQKGFREDEIRSVKEDYLDENDFSRNCLSCLLQKTRHRELNEDDRKKAVQFLLRQGFSGDDIKKALAEY
ncbi:MAG: RecX family transcriptional regulator [Clostridia bacterium]|nr:RecX family transcriptional regulator [Clostridia bacterium]